jgi:hypothetical protein
MSQLVKNVAARQLAAPDKTENRPIVFVEGQTRLGR